MTKVVRTACYAGMLFVGLTSRPAGGTELPPVTYDLVERFSSAEMQTEVGVVQLGRREASPLLVEGWEGNRSDGAEKPFRYGIGDHSEIRFFLSKPRNLAMSFHCWPFRSGDTPPQRIAIAVNGHQVEEVTLSTMPARYRIEVPAKWLVAGDNRLALRYAWSREPTKGATQSHHGPPLAVAWDWIDLGGGGRSRAAPQAVGDGAQPAITVPPGSAVDYYVDIAPGSFLTLDGVVPVRTVGTSKPAPLEIELQTDTMARRRLEPGRPSAEGRYVIPLPVPERSLARISFRAPGDGGESAPEWRLVRPAVRSPTGTEQAPPGALLGTDGEKPNVIIYLIDTLRADHLGCYGYEERPTSPRIDAFAGQATLFAQTRAQSSHTRPSVATIFTGLDPRLHRVQYKRDALPSSALTLAELLQQSSYETAGFITNGNISAALGFGQGFDTYKMIGKGEDGEIPTSGDVNQAAFEWLSRRQRERPFFLYLHSVDPHQPYTPPSPYRERFAPDVDVDRLGFIKDHLAGISAGDRSDVMRLYDAEIALSDANFGAFVDHLQTLGLYDASLIILIADHGEEFHEHGGWLHGKTLYDEALRVPLVIKFPHGFGAGVRSDQLAQQVDILPTVLAVVGQDVPPQLHGRNLIPLVTATGGPQPPAFSARVREGSAMESVSAGGMKLIHNRYGRTPTLELYDLALDPGERHNLVAEREVARGYLQALLRATQPSETDSLPRAAAKLDAATKERLRALGYAP